MVARGRAAGYTIGRVFTGSEGFPNAYVVGPDGVNVEVQEETSLQVLAVAQHLHYLLPEPLVLRTWYVNTFSMLPAMRGPYGSADIPGMNLTFAPAKGGDPGTKGGLIDHIGFEVKDLADYCKRLEAAGIKFDLPFTKVPDLGISRAFLADPREVLIELTEGLGAY